MMEHGPMAGRSTIAYVVEYVRSHPGCTKFDASSGNTRYGYKAVDRAIRHGLITATYANNKYALQIAEPKDRG